MRRAAPALLVAAAMACAAPALAAPAKPAGFDKAWSAAAADWRADIKAKDVVGASVWFAHDGQVLAKESYGLADLETKRPVDERTIYHWASITKTFTAISIMQLRDRGLISLDDPVVKYVPELADVHDPFGPIEQITIRQVLSHSAGFRDPTWPWRDEDWQPYEPPRWEQIAAMMPYTEIEFAPGSKYSYSNPGISFLGRVIEKVTGEDYEVYVDKNILRPLGMRESYFDFTPPHLLKHRSNNYSQAKDGKLTANGLELDTAATVANGGLNAPVGDMMRYADFLLGVGDTTSHGTVLSRKSLEEMWAPVLPTPDSTEGLKEQIALVFFIEDDIKADAANPVRYIGHTGSQQGFLAFIYIEPTSKTATVAAWNTRPEVKPRDLVYGERRRLFDKIFPLFRKAR